SGHVDLNKTALSTPKISAIISTYSSESHIAECLSDLVSQSIADQIEIVIIDANSPQNECAVVERFQARFPNIRYHRTPTRIGIYAAWNMAVKLARGDYIITCSTNDRLRIDTCEILARALDENPDVTLVYGNSFLTKVPHESFERPTLCGLYCWPAFDFEQLLDHCMVGPHPMWRRSVHDEIGYFNEEYVALGDQDFWLRMGERSKLLSLPDFTGLYYVSEESITGDADLTQVEADQVHSHYGWRHRYAKWFAERNRRGMPGGGPGDEPVTQIFVLAMRNSDEMLANTLDSIANQLNQNWRLTVLSDRPSPDVLFEGEARLGWVQCPETETVTAMLYQLVLQDHSSQWVCLIDAGDQLEPAFLSDIHRYLTKYPRWKLVYTDHDLVDGNGDLSDPRFKPNWNLELLRSTAYIGNSLIVSRTALVETGGFGVHEEALHYDLVLRTHDQFGGDSIGHVAEILLHRHAVHVKDGDSVSLDQQRHTLEQHLQRCGLTTLLREGVSKGSFMLDYQPEYLPKVSVLVEASGSMDRLSSCLQSVLTKTEYPSFEVCVLIACDLLADISKNLERLVAADARLKIVPVARTLQVANGEYLVWMREEILVLQPNWLRRLVHYGVRKDVGVVGARIVDHKKTLVDGGIMLGTGDNGVGLR
ncbi:MAG: glycosyltransferase, partial [Pseudomonadota bacterium]|nr:glycosyltransferase [Pseudomonadota bacterium]